MKRLLTLAIAALVLFLGAGVARAQSDEEIISQLKESLRKKLDKVRRDMETEIDKAFGGSSAAPAPKTQAPKIQAPKTTAPPTTTAPAERPKIGFSLFDGVPEGVQRLNGLKAGEGVMVSSVAEGSIAARAGLQVNDIILSINGAAIGQKSQVGGVLKKLAVGEKLEFAIVRNGQRSSLSTRYSDNPDGAAAPREIPPELLQQLPPGVDPQQLQEMMQNGQLPPDIQNMLGDPQAIQDLMDQFLGQGGDPQQQIQDLLGGQDPNSLLEQFFPDGAPPGIQDLLNNFLGGGQPKPPAETPAEKPAQTPAPPAGDQNLDQFFNDIFNTPPAQKPAGKPTFEFAAKNGAQGGAELTRVTEGGASANAGLKAGDVVTKIGATAIQSTADIKTAMGGLAPGDKVKVEYTRGGKKAAATITVGEKK